MSFVSLVTFTLSCRRTDNFRRFTLQLLKIADMLANKALIIAVFCITATVATPFKPCKVGAPPNALRISGCDTEPCKFRRGSTFVGEVDFALAEDIEDLVPRFRATFLGLATVTYPLAGQNVCQALINGSCPFVANKQVTAGVKIPILKSYPKISAVVELSFLDKAGNVHICFKTRGKIVKK